MSMTFINTTDAKEEFSELLNRVSHNKERIVLTRRGKNVAAIVPMEDFLQLQDSQHKQDLEEAMEALKEARSQGSASLDDLKFNLG